MFFNKKQINIALEIGHRSHKLVRLAAHDGSSFQLSDYSIIPHESNISLAALSESSLTEPRTMYSLIKKSLDTMKIRSGKVALVLPDSYVLCKIISLKGPLDPETTKDKIRTKLQTVLPLPLERFNLSYQVVGEFNKKYLVVTEVMLEHNSQEIEKVVRKLGFSPVLIDSSSLNGQNLFNEYLESGLNRNKNIALLNLGHSAFTILLFKNGELRLNITKGIGISSLIEELSRSRQITIKNAAKILERETTFLPEVSEEQEKIENYAAVKEGVSEIIRHFFAFFEYYLDRFHETRIDEVIAYGGGANIRNLLPFLANHINIPVKPGCDLVNLFHKGKQISPEDRNLLIPAVAAAYRTWLPD